MTHALGANGLTPRQIETPDAWTTAPEAFLDSFRFTVHFINSLAVLSVLFAFMRGPRKE